MTLTAEEGVILLSARANLSAEAINTIKNLLKDKSQTIDYRNLLKLAAMNDVAPLLYHALKDLDIIPENIMNELKNTYLHTVANNIRNAGEMIRLLTIFKENRLEALPLKGSIASDIIFGDPGLYPSRDIDLLVRPDDLRKTEKILIKSGYRKDDYVPEEDLFRSHYHLLFNKDSHAVEVHWNLAKRYFDIPPGFWWEDAGRAEYEGMEIPVLSIERYLLYTVFRLYDHGFRPLKFFVLISELINKYREGIEWHKLSEFSQRFRMSRLVTFTLKLLNDILGTEINKEIAKQDVCGYRIFKRVILSGLFGEAGRPHQRMFIYTFLQDKHLDTVKILASRIFPTMSEIRLRYGLHSKSKRIYLYYLFNPLLLLLKSDKKANT